MDKARFRRVFDHWKGLVHQIDAVDWLFDRIPEDVRRQFGVRFSPPVPTQGKAAGKAPYMHLTASGNWNQSGTLQLLHLDFYLGPYRKARIKAYSGAPGMQHSKYFREASKSIPLTNEPIPEGKWVLPGKPGAPDTTLEWAAGMDDYSSTWGPGIGPVWVSLEYAGPGTTRRSAIGIHLDDNVRWAPGSAGCIVLPTKEDLRYFVTCMRQYDPRVLWVDWGRGTVPTLPSLFRL